MQKKALLALLVAAVLMFSGCALVVTDPVADNAQVVLSVNGETLNKGTVSRMVQNTIQTNEQNNYYAQMFGMSPSADTNPVTVLSSTLTESTKAMVQKQKAKELGFDQLSEEDAAEAKKMAQEQYENFLSQVETQFLSESENTGDALRQEAIEYAKNNGYEFDAAVAEEEYRLMKSLDNMRKDVVKEVSVTEEEVKALYDEKVAAEKEAFAADPSAFGNAFNQGRTVYYVPQGYRVVKQVLVKFTQEDQEKLNTLKTALGDANSAVTMAETTLNDAKAAAENPAEGADADALNKAVLDAQADLDTKKAAAEKAQADYDAALEKAYSNVSERANEVAAKAQAGEDFDALIKEYNEDPGMTDAEGNVKAGYAVCADFAGFDPAFLTAAMGLEKVGDVSAPAKGMYGYYIIRYSEDLPEGSRDMELVRGVLTEEKLTEKQNALFDETVEKWVNEADVKVYPEKMGY